MRTSQWSVQAFNLSAHEPDGKVVQLVGSGIESSSHWVSVEPLGHLAQTRWDVISIDYVAGQLEPWLLVMARAA